MDENAGAAFAGSTFDNSADFMNFQTFQTSHAIMRFLLWLLLLLPALPVIAQEKTEIDLKTKIFEKPELTAAKNGTLLLLNQSEWGTVVETGEEYALWIRDARREERGDSIALTVDLELREPSFLQEGALLSSRTITIVYSSHGDWHAAGAIDAVETIEMVEHYSDLALKVAGLAYPLTSTGIRAALLALDEILPGGFDRMKLEALVSGVVITANARAMIEERGRVGERRSRRPGCKVSRGQEINFVLDRIDRKA